MMTRLRHTWSLIFATFAYQMRIEQAFLGNFWFNLLSKIIYNVMFLVFIDQLFKRVGAIGNYTQNDFLFMYFVSQVGFYLIYYTLFVGATRLVEMVRLGSFDFLLLRPIPHRLFTYIGAAQPIDFISTAIPGCTIVALLIDWGSLSFSPLSILLGILVWFSGIIICNTLLFALTLPAFKTGDASEMLNVFYSITSMAQMQYSKQPLLMKALALCLLPQLVIAGAAAEVMLMKSSAVVICTPVFIAAGISLIMYQVMWRYALRNYTSASS